MAIDIDPGQDDGHQEEDGQHDAHDGAQVQGGALCLGGQVVLKACGETIRSGEQGRWGHGVLGSDKVPEMKADRTFRSTYQIHAKVESVEPL